MQGDPRFELLPARSSTELVIRKQRVQNVLNLNLASLGIGKLVQLDFGEALFQQLFRSLSVSRLRALEDRIPIDVVLEPPHPSPPVHASATILSFAHIAANPTRG